LLKGIIDSDHLEHTDHSYNQISQLMLKAKYDGSYYKEGRLVNRYTVSGSAAELETYAASQGEFLRKNAKGQLLFFTGFAGPDEAPLIISQKTGRASLDLSQFERAAAMVNRMGGDFGKSFADATVAKLLGTTVGATSNAPAAAAPVVEEGEGTIAASESLDQH
jgi:hypothetical protein